MTSEMWLGYAEKEGRREVLMALRHIAPSSAVVFAESAEELRERFGDEEPRTVGAIVGQTGEGVSALNLAAALARDGVASEVVLVARGASGSLRSRAGRAGISCVVDTTALAQQGQPRPLTIELPVERTRGQAGEQLRDGLARNLPPIDDEGEIVEVRPVAGEPAELSQALGQAQPGLQVLPQQMPQTRAESLQSQAQQAPVQLQGQPQVRLQAGSQGRPQLSVQPQADAQGQEQQRVQPQLLSRPADAAPVLTVCSGRGGVGKTALIAMMASLASRWDMDVAVVDLDLSCGNLHSCFGVNKGPDLLRIAPDGRPTPEAMGRASVRCGERVHLWGPVERPETAELVMPHVATLLSYLSAHYDLVLVDSSTTFTDGVAQAVQACDRMLVVHDERPGAVASAARISALAVRLGVARTRIVRVVNLADPRVRASAFEGRAEVGLETARMYRVVDGGVECEDLLAAGKVDEVCHTDAPAVECVSTMLAQVLTELGCLPDNERARKAFEQRGAKRRFPLFGKRKEAV